MDASVTFLLENVKELVLNHVSWISGAESELKKLQDELSTMKAILEDASKTRKKEEIFKQWEKQIRDVVYEMEDAIDDCLTDKAKAKAKGKANSTIEKIKRMASIGTSTTLANKVKSLREDRVKKVFNDAGLYFSNLPKIDSYPESTLQLTDEWRKGPRKSRIVGLEDETEKVINYLKEESAGLEVISIIGMPGLGKTTLAWKIFQDPGIHYEYPVRIWVTVSQELNIKDVYVSIMKEFTKQTDILNKSSEELAPLVRERLEKAKFLLIMDDVWTRESWHQIKEALPMNNRLGKVLITTRHREVAYHANSTRVPHTLRFLREDESWELLQYEVYGNGKLINAVKQELEKVGKLIAKQCDGLPLSIIVIAGILVDKISTSMESTKMIRNEWEIVSERVKEYLITQDKQQRMIQIISLSYTRLPYDLRDCFLYLGMFPEDAEISAWELIRLWIAEGFIQQVQQKSLEEIAEDNLKELIARNLVMLEKTKLGGEVKTCRVHDSIREFCKTKALEQNLFQEIKKKEKEGVFEPTDEKIKECRRLCIHSYVHDLFLRNLKKIPSRSFLCFPKDPIHLELKDMSNVTETFSLLRVYNAENIKFPKFPQKITQLYHLRYLTLSLAYELKTLPEDIFNLWNLRTLIVDTMSRGFIIKADIWKTRHLRHLKTNASITLTATDGKGKGNENLKTLGRLSPESCTKSVFAKAMNLYTLGIHGDLLKLSESNCLEELQRLNKLKLEHDLHPKIAGENKLGKLPESRRFPRNLKILTLKGSYLDWTQMKTLGNLEKLEVLKLKDNAFVGHYWKVSDGGFDNLEFLYIKRTDLVIWTATSVHSFPKLKSLTLKNCEKLDGIPFELNQSLEILSVERVTKSTVLSAMEIQRAKPQSHEAWIGGFKLLIAPGDKISSHISSPIGGAKEINQCDFNEPSASPTV